MSKKKYKKFLKKLKQLKRQKMLEAARGVAGDSTAPLPSDAIQPAITPATSILPPPALEEAATDSSLGRPEFISGPKIPKQVRNDNIESCGSPKFEVKKILILVAILIVVVLILYLVSIKTDFMIRLGELVARLLHLI